MDEVDRSIEFTWTMREVHRLQFQAIRVVEVFLVVVGAVSLVSFLQGNSSLAWVLFPFGVLALLHGYLTWVWFRRAGLRAPTRITWDQDSMTVAGPSMTSSFALTSIRSLAERGGLLLLRIGPSSQTVPVPDRAFASPAQRADLLDAIRAAMPDAGRRWRDRAPTWAIAAAVVLVVGGLAVWGGLRSDPQEAEQAELAEARERWEAVGPADYDLDYLITYPDRGSLHCAVKVRAGVVSSSAGFGSAACIEPTTMDGLLDYVDGALGRGPDSVGELAFDEATGALVRFSVDEDGTDEGRWSITVVELAPG